MTLTPDQQVASDLLEASAEPQILEAPLDSMAGATEAKRNLRDLRNLILEKSDWTQAIDSPLSNEKKAEWATYRQSLRELTNSSDWPNVTFPTPPTK